MIVTLSLPVAIAAAWLLFGLGWIAGIVTGLSNTSDLAHPSDKVQP